MVKEVVLQGYCGPPCGLRRAITWSITIVLANFTQSLNLA